MVPRKPVAFTEKKYSNEVVFASLNTPPYERTSWQIDSLTMFFMNSPEFLRIAKNKREVRILAQNIELEFHNPNSLLFSINEDFDGIYFIYKGEVALIREKKEVESSNPNIKLPSGNNNSVRQNKLKYYTGYRKSDQDFKNDFFYNENKNINTKVDSLQWSEYIYK